MEPLNTYLAEELAAMYTKHDRVLMKNMLQQNEIAVLQQQIREHEHTIRNLRHDRRTVWAYTHWVEGWARGPGGRRIPRGAIRAMFTGGLTRIRAVRPDGRRFVSDNNGGTWIEEVEMDEQGNEIIDLTTEEEFYD